MSPAMEKGGVATFFHCNRLLSAAQIQMNPLQA